MKNLAVIMVMGVAILMSINAMGEEDSVKSRNLPVSDFALWNQTVMLKDSAIYEAPAYNVINKETRSESILGVDKVQPYQPSKREEASMMRDKEEKYPDDIIVSFIVDSLGVVKNPVVMTKTVPLKLKEKIIKEINSTLSPTPGKLNGKRINSKAIMVRNEREGRTETSFSPIR